MRKYTLLAVGLLLIASGCDVSERISRLEKQNKDLEAKQGKCSKEARTWFNENMGSGDKNTILLTYTDHYNKQLNKCFILVDYRYHPSFLGGVNPWVKDLTLWDVQENAKYGKFSETHVTNLKPTLKMEDNVLTCEVYGKKCQTEDEFNKLVAPFLNS
jgi:hypothetical protein